MTALVQLPHPGRTEAEGLIGLVAGGAGTPIRSEALKEGVVFANFAGGIERSHSAG